MSSQAPLSLLLIISFFILLILSDTDLPDNVWSAGWRVSENPEPPSPQDLDTRNHPPLIPSHHPILLLILLVSMIGRQPLRLQVCWAAATCAAPPLQLQAGNPNEFPVAAPPPPPPPPLLPGRRRRMAHLQVEQEGPGGGNWQAAADDSSSTIRPHTCSLLPRKQLFRHHANARKLPPITFLSLPQS